MQKYLIVNDNEVSYRTFSDEELITLALTSPDTALLTIPFGVVARLVNKFTNIYADYIRETVFDYTSPSLVRVFVNAVNKDSKIHTKLAIIKDGEGTVIELDSLDATPDNGKVFVRNLYDQLEIISSNNTYVEVYADKVMPLYNTIKQTVMYEYSKPNLTLYGIDKNGLARQLISNPDSVKTDWCYLAPQSFVIDEPDFSKDKVAYTRHIRQLAKELRDKIFNKYEEVKESLDTPQVVVTQVDDTEPNVDPTDEFIVAEETLNQVPVSPLEEIGIELAERSEVETTVPVSIEIAKETVVNQEEPLSESEAISELKQAQVRIRVLERQIADNEELHKSELDSYKARLAKYESQNDDIAERKVNDIEIERLTEQLVRLTQVEIKYKELMITHEELVSEYNEFKEDYIKLQVDVVNLQHDNSRLTLESDEAKERALALNNQLIQDSNLVAILNKVSVMEHLLNGIDSKVSKSPINVVSVDTTPVVEDIPTYADEFEAINKRVAEIMEEDTVNEEPYSEEFYENDTDGEPTLEESFVEETVKEESSDKEENVEDEMALPEIPEPLEIGIEEFGELELPVLPDLEEVEEEVPVEVVHETEEERSKFDEFFEGEASLTDYLKTKSIN